MAVADEGCSYKEPRPRSTHFEDESRKIVSGSDEGPRRPRSKRTPVSPTQLTTMPRKGVGCSVANIFTAVLLGMSLLLVLFSLRASTTAVTVDAMNALGAWMPRPRNTLVIYAETRNGFDRAGMIITEMMNAHAFSFRNGSTYGGYCLPTSLAEETTEVEAPVADNSTIVATTVKGVLTEDMNGHHAEAQRILTALGLQDELIFACPNAAQIASGKHLLSRGLYHSLATQKIWSADWIAEIQSQLRFPTAAAVAADSSDSTYRVAVHIRRGDVTPCKHTGRYLSNSHYERVLMRYIPTAQRKTAAIEVFSESNSFEPWDDLVRRWTSLDGFGSVQLRLDTNLSDVWQSLVAADLVVLSRSTFGMVPAMLNNHGTVIYTPFPRRRLPHWIAVPDQLVRQNEVDTLEIKRQLCPS